MTPKEKRAYENLIAAWGEDTAKKILNVIFFEPFDEFDTFEGEDNCTLTTFIKKYCTACGGDWGQMILTGIKKLWSEVYDVIPDDMGMYAISGLINTLILCGVEVDNND